MYPTRIAHAVHAKTFGAQTSRSSAGPVSDCTLLLSLTLHIYVCVCVCVWCVRVRACHLSPRSAAAERSC